MVSTYAALFSLVVCMAGAVQGIQVPPLKEKIASARSSAPMSVSMDGAANIAALAQLKVKEEPQEDEKEDNPNPHECSEHVGHATHEAADDVAELLHEEGFHVGKLHHLMRHVDHKLEEIFAEFAHHDNGTARCHFTAADIERELTAEGMANDAAGISALIDSIDENDDGEVTFHEFDVAMERGTEHHANQGHKQAAHKLLDLAHEIDSTRFHKHQILRHMHDVDVELYEAFEDLDDDASVEMTTAHLESAGFTAAQASEIMTAAHDGAGAHDGEISLREFEELMDEGLCHIKHSHTSEEKDAVQIIKAHLENESDDHEHGINVAQLIKEVNDVDAVIEEIFDEWDSNGDGEIELSEVESLADQEGLPHAQEHLEAAFKHVACCHDQHPSCMSQACNSPITVVEFDRMLEAGTKHLHRGVHHHEKSAAELFIEGAERKSGDNTMETRLEQELRHQHLEMKALYGALNPDHTDDTNHKISETMLADKLEHAGHLAAHEDPATEAQEIIDAGDEDGDDELDIDEFEFMMEMGTRHHDRGHAHFHTTPEPTQ